MSTTGTTTMTPPPAPSQASAPAAPKEKFNLKKWLSVHWVDLLLLVTSAGCFGGFIQGSIYLRELSAIGGPVGVLKVGEVEKKAAGNTLFLPVTAGGEFHNMDAVWTGKQTASIRLDNGSLLELKERTLVVLKKPFKNLKKFSLEERVKIIQGSVTVTESPALPNASKTEMKAKENRPEMEPAKEGQLQIPASDKPKEDAAGAKIEEGFYPVQNVLIFSRRNEPMEIPIRWPKAVTGALIVRNDQTGKVTGILVKNEKFANVKLDQNHSYHWQVVDNAQNVVFGPYDFELKYLTQAHSDDMVKQGMVRPVELHW